MTSRARYPLGILLLATLYLVTGHRTSVLLFPKMRSAAYEFFARQFEEQLVALARN